MKVLPVKGLGWQSGAELFRTRVVYKSLDAALTASLRPRRNRQEYLKTIFKLNSSNYERVAAWTNLVDSFLPGFAGRLSAKLINSSRFPFAGGEIELMSFGSGSTVFLLKRPDKDWVLKVYRRSLGKTPRGLAEIVQHFKGKYETVRSWYNGRYELVPPAHFLIIYGPLFSRPAAAVVQPFIYGRKSDFFLDHSNQELIGKMESDPELAGQFLFFAEQTLDVFEKQRLCVDFLGRENVMLVEKDGRHRLLVVDNGIFDMESLKNSAPTVSAWIEIRLERLSYLRGVMK